MKYLPLITILFVSNLYGQKRYKFKYDYSLKTIPSSYVIYYDSLTNKDSFTKIISIASDADTIVQASIQIHSLNKDTIIHPDFSKIKTITKLNIVQGYYDVKIACIEFSLLEIKKIKIYPHTSTIIIAKLGYDNSLEGGQILSKRKLTENEQNEIINDLSNRKRENKLIKNKTCIISMAI